jgi:hypothetical protein
MMRNLQQTAALLEQILPKPSKQLITERFAASPTAARCIPGDCNGVECLGFIEPPSNDYETN